MLTILVCLSGLISSIYTLYMGHLLGFYRSVIKLDLNDSIEPDQVYYYEFNTNMFDPLDGNLLTYQYFLNLNSLIGTSTPKRYAKLKEEIGISLDNVLSHMHQDGNKLAMTSIEFPDKGESNIVIGLPAKSMTCTAVGNFDAEAKSFINNKNLTVVYNETIIKLIETYQKTYDISTVITENLAITIIALCIIEALLY